MPTKSADEIEAEKWLVLVAKGHDEFFVLRSIRFNRWYLVTMTFLNLFLVGSALSTDFLAQTIDGFFLGEPRKYAVSGQIVGMFIMGISTALCGPFIERRAPRMSMAISTGLVVLGWILALFSVMFHVYPLLYVGYMLHLPLFVLTVLL